MEGPVFAKGCAFIVYIQIQVNTNDQVDTTAELIRQVENVVDGTSGDSVSGIRALRFI